MKRFFLVALLFFAAGSARAANEARWPACAPILGFNSGDIGVASYELDPSTRPAGAWLCLAVNKTSQRVRLVTREEFDLAFPNAIASGNRQPGDCQETVEAPPPGSPVELHGQETCIRTKVFCEGTEVSVRVSSTVAGLPCPARLFSAATIIGDGLWVGIAPLDPYRREYPGAGLLLQILDGSVASRLTPRDIGGKQVCAIRKDPFSNAIWATTDNGLVELTSSGKVKRILQIRSHERPK